VRLDRYTSVDMIVCDRCGRSRVTNDGKGSGASQVAGKLGEDRQVGVQPD